MTYGPTADIDNREIPVGLLKGFKDAYALVIRWHRPTEAIADSFRCHPTLAAKGDRIVGIANSENLQFWALENDLEGFPDPAQYFFAAVGKNGSVSAKGAFDNWPDNWRWT